MLKTQRTEKFLFGGLSVLLLILGWNFLKNDPLISTEVASAESQDGGSVDEGDSDTSSASDEDSGNSSNSEDEESEPSVASTPSEKSVPSTTQARTQATAADAVSEKSTSQEGMSVASVNDDTGQLSAESVKSLHSEDSSIKTVSTEGNVSLVKREGKLFFLIPVEIESQITTNDTGTIVAEKRDFLNWLKNLFSF